LPRSKPNCADDKDGGEEAAMTQKLAGMLAGVLCLVSCGDLTERKPVDWNSRISFSEKPYEGNLFKEWDNVTLTDGTQAREEGYAHGLSKSQHWRGSGSFLAGITPVYYVFWAENSVTLTIDWKYLRENKGCFDSKKLGKTILDDYGMLRKQVSLGANEYLVMRISPPDEKAVFANTKPDWEISFTVD
jgi:hypothetical protein